MTLACSARVSGGGIPSSRGVQVRLYPLVRAAATVGAVQENVTEVFEDAVSINRSTGLEAAWKEHDKGAVADLEGFKGFN